MSENHFEPLGWRHRHFTGQNGQEAYEAGAPYDSNTEILQLSPVIAYAGLWLSALSVSSQERKAQVENYYRDLHKATGIIYLLIQKKDGRPPLGGVPVEPLPSLYCVDLREF